MGWGSFILMQDLLWHSVNKPIPVYVEQREPRRTRYTRYQRAGTRCVPASHCRAVLLSTTTSDVPVTSSEASVRWPAGKSSSSSQFENHSVTYEREFLWVTNICWHYLIQKYFTVYFCCAFRIDFLWFNETNISIDAFCSSMLRLVELVEWQEILISVTGCLVNIVHTYFKLLLDINIHWLCIHIPF